MPKNNFFLPFACLLAVFQVAHGLTSGPAMPEYNDFESIDNTDLVNLVTGEFAYTIPVMTVPGPGLGFPLVLNYHAGVQPEQEASWVGLGWNLQAGAVTRQINNIPDDFKGVLVEERIKATTIRGWMASIGFNGVTVGISRDNEMGLGGMVGYSYGKGAKGTPFSAGVGFTAGVGGVWDGVGITASVKAGKGDNARVAGGLSVGIHSRDGVTGGLSGGVSFSNATGDKKSSFQTSLSLANVGVSMSSSKGASAGASLGIGSSVRNSVQSGVTDDNAQAWVPLYTPWTGYMEINWGYWNVEIDGLQQDRYYGFLYSDMEGMGCLESDPSTCYSTEEFYRRCTGCSSKQILKKMDFVNEPGYTRGFESRLGYTGEDFYSVQSQGMSGTFKPIRTEDGDYYSYTTDQATKTLVPEILDMFEGRSNGITSRNLHTAAHSSRDRIAWRYNEEVGGGLYTRSSLRDDGPEINAASKKIQPIFGTSGSGIKGWVLTSQDGVKYLYTQTQYNWLHQTMSASDQLLLDWTRRETPGYAYAWLLTAILSPDYVRMRTLPCVDGIEEGCLPGGNDLGGWVRFDYTDPKLISWRTPLGRPSEISSYTPGGNATGYSAAMGVKTISYLKSVETPTHRADMGIAEDSRKDGLPPEAQSIGFLLPRENYGKIGEIVDWEACTREQPVRLPKWNYSIKIPQDIAEVGGLPLNTKISVIVRRWGVKKVWRCESEWTNPLHCAEQCRVRSKDDVIGTFTLTNPLNGYYNLPDILSTEIENIRIVVAEIDSREAAHGLAYLTSVRLFNKQFEKEISAVRFSYDYSLAQGTPNSESSIEQKEGGNKGRLTMKALQIGASIEGPWNPPYLFEYSGVGTNYHMDKKDYWGYYCNTCTIQKKTPDGTADIWNLQRITTPAGSRIEVGYQPKEIQYSEGFPLIMPGNEIGGHLTLESDPLVVCGSDVRNPVTNSDCEMPRNAGMPFSKDEAMRLDAIPQEIATLMDGKKIMYLGRIDLAWGPLDLKAFERLDIPGIQYIVEAPRVIIEEVQPINPGDPSLRTYEVVAFGLSSSTGSVAPDPRYIPAATGRITCPGMKSCDYDVGLLLDGNLPNQHVSFYHKLWHKVVNIANPGDPIQYEEKISYNLAEPKLRPVFARVWAIIPSTTPAVFYGGGLRVDRLSFIEPFSNKANIFDYDYNEAATPTLPGSMYNFTLDIRHSDADGIKPYLGNPGVLHGKVTATFQPGTPKAYSTDYEFVTSKDLPIRITQTGLATPESGNLRNKVKILDRSGLWGSLWRRIEKNALGVAVRTDLSEWTTRITPELKAALGIPTGESLTLSKSSQTVLWEYDANTNVLSSNSKESDYFGVSQKLWSNRYVPIGCEQLTTEAQKLECTRVRNGAFSVQYELLRFAPIARKQYFVQDGLKNYIEKNLFDFRTGVPLVEIRPNKKPDGAMEYYASLQSLAHHHPVYSGMKDANMLSQEFSLSTFHFDQNPSGKIFSNLPDYDLEKVTTSKVTHWSDFIRSGTHRFRKQESYVMRDKTGFGHPTPATAPGNPNWVSQGKNMVYDDFGHVLEFKNALGQNAAQIFGFGHSLPTAFAQNAKSNEIQHQGFEDPGFSSDVLGGNVNHVQSASRSKTGNSSLKVVNCKEEVGGVRVPKPEQCGDPSLPSEATFLCFDAPDLDMNQTYIASAWYYDEFQGSNPANPMDPNYLTKYDRVTRPGIFLGVDGQAGCAAESHPNGANYSRPQEEWIYPADNDDWNASQRAVGDRNWRRIWTELKPQPTCSNTGKLESAILCLYASKHTPGSDVFFDEVRVRPKNALMETFAYDFKGNLVSSTNANEVSRYFEYDEFGNLTGQRNDDGVLMSEQAKKYGKRPIEFEMTRLENYYDGCQEFTLTTSPVGQDNNFEFIESVPANAVVEFKTSSSGRRIPTLCYSNFQPFELKLIMRATGRVHSFPIGLRQHRSIVITEEELSFTIASDWSKPYNWERPRYYSALSRAEAFVVRLPNESELKAANFIPAGDVLQSYKVRFQMKGSIIEENDPILPSLPLPGNNDIRVRMHLRHNYFEDHHASGTLRYGVVGGDTVQLDPADNGTVRRKRNFLNASDLALVRPPKGYDLDKTIYWPYTTVPLTDQEMVGDLSVLAGKRHALPFCIFQYNMGESWENLVSFDRSEAPIPITVTITPITQFSQGGP